MLAAAAVAVIAVAIGGVRLDAGAARSCGSSSRPFSCCSSCSLSALLLSGGPAAGLNLLVIPVLGGRPLQQPRAGRRGARQRVLVILATLVMDPSYVVAHPESFVVPLILVLCAAAYISPLVASDVRHRADSTLDQLTGLLNRRALEPRFAEIAEQAALSGQPVSVVLADLDHFKSINDEHGHGVGDAVLRDVAYAMRRALRTFELLYRLGGEEFVLLLPGAARRTRRASPRACAPPSRSWNPPGCTSRPRSGWPPPAGSASRSTVSSRTPTRRSTPPSAVGATASSAATARASRSPDAL